LPRRYELTPERTFIHLNFQRTLPTLSASC
jgi:hypothetical protein